MGKKTRDRPGNLAGLLLAMIMSAGMAMEAAQAAAGESTPAAFRWKDGAEVYAKVCGYCHDGGKVGPQLLGRALPPPYIQMVVRNGNRAMPAFRAAEIDDESLRKLADFVSRQGTPQ